MSQRPLRVVRGQEPEEPPAGTPDRLDFDDFFATESENLFRTLWLITRNRAEAEDVMQDAFLSLYERWTGYAIDSSEGACTNRFQRLECAAARGSRPERHSRRRGRRRRCRGRAHRIGISARAAQPATAGRDRADRARVSSEDAGTVLGIRAVTARVLSSRRVPRCARTGADD
jgi:hypothetical protein